MDYCLRLQGTGRGGRNGIKIFTHTEVEAHCSEQWASISEWVKICSLARERLQASSSHGIDDGLEGIEIRDGCEQFGATEAPGHRLTVRNIDVGNAVLLEEIEDGCR